MSDSTAGPAELIFTRVFEAPRELVFQCMTQPEHLTHFWGPAGTSAPIEHITVDARPGGPFETVMINDADGSRYPTRAVFDEVVEPERLVWTESQSGMTVTVTFTDLGARTGVEIRQFRVPDAVRSPEAQAGFRTSLDRFARYLAALTATRRPWRPWHGAAAMTAADAPATDITRLIAGERRELAAVLAGLPAQAWDSPTLCAGWRVREVVAHITMPFRYRPPRFAAEMIRSRGSFSRMADRCARRDGTAPPSQLAADLRDNEDHPWKPPGGGYPGALTHDVIHGLDITVALGLGRRVPGTPGDRPGQHLRRQIGPVLRHRSRRGGIAGRRPRLVVRVRRARVRLGPGSRARGVRPEAPARAAARRPQRPVHPVAGRERDADRHDRELLRGRTGRPGTGGPGEAAGPYRENAGPGPGQARQIRLNGCTEAA